MTASPKGASKSDPLVEEMRKILARRRFTDEQQVAYDRFVARMRGESVSATTGKKSSVRDK